MSTFRPLTRPDLGRSGVGRQRGDRTQQETGSAPAVEVPRFYSVAQVAAMLGMSPMTVYRAIHDGQFPAVRIRGRLIVPARAVEAMVEAAVADQAMVDAAQFVPAGVTLP